MTTADKVSVDAARARAEARFALKEQRATEAEKVLAEIGAQKVAEAEKTARLRALRLAKEEADRAAAVVAKPAARSAKTPVRRAKTGR